MDFPRSFPKVVNMPSEIVTVSEKEVLDNVKRNILEDKRDYLCKHLNPSDHFDYLRSKSIISRDDQEVVLREVTQRGKAGKLLDILLTKGPEAYEKLVLSIQLNKTQTFLVKMLNEEFETRKNAYISLLRNEKRSMEADLDVDLNLLPKPHHHKLEKQCVESEDLTLTPDSDKDIDEIYVRQSYVDCKESSESNGTGEYKRSREHDVHCTKHQSDA